MQYSDAVSALVWKRDQMIRNDPQHAKVRPVLLLFGGGVRGVNAAGASYALNLMGFGQVFVGVSGVSAGALAAAFFPDDTQGEYAARLVRGFSSGELSRYICYLPRPHFDPMVMTQFLTDSQRGICYDRLRNTSVKLTAGVTRSCSGRTRLLSLSPDVCDPVLTLQATIALPGLCKEVSLGGEPYVDGGCGAPLPFYKVLDSLHPTHLVVITNRTQKNPFLVQERIASSLMSQGFSSAVRRTTIQAERRYHRFLRYVRKMWGSRALIIDAPYTLHPLCRNPTKIARAAQDAADLVWELFGRTERLTFL